MTPNMVYKPEALVLRCSGDLVGGLDLGLMGLLVADCRGLQGISSGLTRSTDHPSKGRLVHEEPGNYAYQTPTYPPAEFKVVPAKL